jgi:hypothetical protein
LTFYFTRFSCQIYEDHAPFDQLQPDEYLLGDKAYIASRQIVSQFKRPPGCQLTQEEQDYNDVHGWCDSVYSSCFEIIASLDRCFFFFITDRCRAGIEHSNHDVKTFATLGGVYRGHVWTASGWRILSSALKIVIHSVSCRNRIASENGRPMRTFANVARADFIADRAAILRRAQDHRHQQRLLADREARADAGDQNVRRLNNFCVDVIDRTDIDPVSSWYDFGTMQ